MKKVITKKLLIAKKKEAIQKLKMLRKSTKVGNVTSPINEFWNVEKNKRG